MKRHLVRPVVGLAAAVLAGATLAGCGGKTEEPPAQPQSTGDGGKVAVVASTNVWGSVVRAVGGDAVDVKAVLNDPGADPHSYQGSPGDVTALKNARLAVYNGGGYDDFFVSMVQENGGSVRKVVAFDVSGKEKDTNEHVWYDLPSVKKVAAKVAEELGAVAPDRKDVFTANAKAFDGNLDTLLGKVEGIGKAAPGAKVLFTEPVPEYLLQAAGLANATPEEFSEAVEEETDPPAAAIAEMTDLLTSKQVAVLVNNAQTETPVTKQVGAAARGAGIPVVDMTETLPEGVTGYLDWMTKQVDALSSALKK